MQTVILAGGRGKRMGELTSNTPKPLLKYDGKNLIKYKLETTKEFTDEFIIVIGYLKDKIKEEIGDEFEDIKVKYALQEELLGTAHALLQAKDLLDDNFLVLMGDDIYEKEDLLRLTEAEKWSVLLNKKEGGNNEITKEDLKNTLTGNPDKYICAGAYFLDKDIFDLEMVKISETEFGLPHTIAQRVENIEGVVATKWKNITNPDDLNT